MTTVNAPSVRELSEMYSALGRYRAARRRLEKGTCMVCQEGFTGTVLRRYCSRRCAVRAHRLRKAQDADSSTSSDS